MLIERAGAVVQALGVVFGALAVVMLARGRLHHAVMAGIMVLMVRMPSVSGPSARMGMPMAMPPTGQGVPLLVLAAFGYAAISACVFVWRMPAFATDGQAAEKRPCATDPLLRGCEVMMLISAAVMMLPMI